MVRPISEAWGSFRRRIKPTISGSLLLEAALVAALFFVVSAKGPGAILAERAAVRNSRAVSIKDPATLLTRDNPVSMAYQIQEDKVTEAMC